MILFYVSVDFLLRPNPELTSTNVTNKSSWLNVTIVRNIVAMQKSLNLHFSSKHKDVTSTNVIDMTLAMNISNLDLSASQPNIEI